jgi:hypothetical protein
VAIVPDPPSAQIGEHQLKNWKLVTCVRQLLAQQLEGQPQPTSDPRRRLAAADYFCLILFGLFNPVVRSLRGLSRASRLPRVQEEVCRSPVSLGSFSEAQHVFDPQVLQRVLQQVAAKAAATFGQNEALARALPELVAHDSTLIKALPRMAWAVWMDKDNPGIRLHVDFEVFRQIPQDVAIEPAGRCERKVWKPRLQAGRFYVGDRYFGHDYNLMRLISRRSSWFVFRLQSNTYLEPVRGSQRPLSPADRAAGVVADSLVRVGKENPQTYRLVSVRVEGLTLELLTNRLDFPAELIALAYKYRWQVELYFKWLKCILGCEHWLAESPRGVAIQVYCALIASVLLALWTGKRPTKRAMEALQLYQLGWASEQDLEQLLRLEKIG